jgi:hypothetical protein
MITALLVLAAAEEETSKTPFYVAAGVLVVFALLIAAIGIRNDEHFPPTKAARSLVILVAVVLVGATMATAVITA